MQMTKRRDTLKTSPAKKKNKLIKKERENENRHILLNGIVFIRVMIIFFLYFGAILIPPLFMRYICDNVLANRNKIRPYINHCTVSDQKMFVAPDMNEKD